MAFITETSEWAEGIYQYEQDDVVEGGPDGIDNIQAKALAARTNYLKALLENLQNGKQTQDQTLTAIAALATAADKFIYFTGEDQAALGTVTAYGRSLLAGADAAAVRALLSAVSQAELNAAIAGLVNSSPATLDTLKELADALGDDPNFATTMTNSLAARVQITDLQKGTHVTATAGGTADAITAAYTPAITTDTAGRIPEVTLSFKATAANTAAGATFNSGTGAFGFVKGASTAIVAGDIPGAGAIVQVRGRRGASAAEDKWVLMNPAIGIAGQNTSRQIQQITASVSGNALTVTLKPTYLDFRSNDPTSGTVNTRTIEADISMTVSSGSTLGTSGGQKSRLAVLAIDIAGTIELAICNMAGGINLDETDLISTVAEGGSGAADSASVIYSTTARFNVPFRIVGFVDITEDTAGTWSSSPTLVQGGGGQALAAMQALGYGQTVQDVKASRALGTTYNNNTWRPIFISAYINLPGSGNGICYISVNGINVGACSNFTVNNCAGQLSAIVPPGASYRIYGSGSISIGAWTEMK